jgi:hypothetical protein
MICFIKPHHFLLFFEAGYMKFKGGWDGVYFDPEMSIPKWNGNTNICTDFRTLTFLQ